MVLELLHTTHERQVMVKLTSMYRVSEMKRTDFIVFSGSKEKRYGLIIDKYQSCNTPNLI
jgi:hypothetical protein